MKLIERIKKDLIGLGTFLLTTSTKVFAKDSWEIQPDYGVYNVKEIPVNTSLKYKIWNICRIYVIPIVLLIGILIYFKKSKSSKKKKILVTIGIISITAILYFIINKIIY